MFGLRLAGRFGFLRRAETVLSKKEENGRRDEEDIQEYRRGGVGRRREQDGQDIEDKVR
jgi:hypothetical protein